MRYDRLCLIINHEDSVTLVGYHPTQQGAEADLENGFPCEGRWRMDYTDGFPAGTDVMEAMYYADAMWGTVFTDNGEVYATDLLDPWNEYKNDSDHLYWTRRNKDLYEQRCTEAFIYDSSTQHNND